MTQLKDMMIKKKQVASIAFFILVNIVTINLYAGQDSYSQPNVHSDAESIGKHDSAIKQNSNKEASWVSFKPKYGYNILDQNNFVAWKVNYLLNAKNDLPSPVTISAQIRAIAFYGFTSDANRFGYLMRFPPDFSGNAASEVTVNNFNIGITGRVTDWLTLFGELRYNPARTFGDSSQRSLNVGTATGGSQTINLGGTADTVRSLWFGLNAYALFGNPDKSDFYFYIGHFNLPFGNMNTFNPFSQTSVWHYFGARGNGASLGYQNSGFKAEFCVVQGGPQERVANAGPDGKVGNFCANAEYSYTYNDFFQIDVGGSFIFGTDYCTPFPIAHFAFCPNGTVNGAWDANIYLSFGKHFSLRGEIARTLSPWPGTAGTPTQPAFFFDAAHVTAFVAEGKIEFDVYTQKDSQGNVVKTIPLALTASWGEGIQGAEKSPWRHNKQFTAALQSKITESVLVYFEYNLVQGFAPLQFMSGFYPDTGGAPGAPVVFVQPSKIDVQENLFLVGVTAAF